jgi:bla regulator protein blaR1
MNYVPQLFESSWAQALGWTLLHSVWQSFAVLGIILMLFRFIPGRQSSVRYAISATGLLSMFLASAATFLYNLAATSSVDYQHTPYLSAPTGQSAASSSIAPGLWDYGYALLQSNISLITACWLAGALFFCLRLAGSWWYVSSLKRQATVLDNEWSLKIAALARQFNIDRIVTLAETAHLSVPAVVGYLKPVILIPTGMLSGLSPDQIESILIHELTHIRRHDYLVNIIQSLVEALFFFNPFVWIISNIIRREREHCCDDAVVSHSNATTYAYALVQLAENRLLKNSSRLTRTNLAVSLAENKNQLLNRITRIMEKSVRNYSGREKIIPVLLLVAGLLCASWISIQSRPEKGKDQQQDKISSADTTIKKHNKGATRSAKKTITPEPDAAREAEISEEEFDVVEVPEPFIYIPPVEVEIPSLPGMEELIAPFPPIEVEINLDMDTIPPAKWGPNRDWEKFSKEFELKFKKQFGDFYEQHQEDLQKMMQEFKHDFQFRYDDKWSKEMNTKMKAQGELLKVQAKVMKLQNKAMIPQKAMKIQDEAKVKQKAMKMDMEKQFQYQEKQLEEVEKKLKSMEENLARFEKALQEQLIQDGYLKSDEKINDMHWNDEGIEINDIKIKESDLPRYKDLHDKYFYIK